MSDILDIAQGTGAAQPFPKQDSGLSFTSSYTSAFYIRIRFRNVRALTLCAPAPSLPRLELSCLLN